jgi:hypothetical protein
MAVNRQQLKDLEQFAVNRKEQAEMDAVEKVAFSLSRFNNIPSKLVEEMGVTRVAYHPPKRENDGPTRPLAGSNRVNAANTHAFLQRKAPEPGECCQAQLRFARLSC